ncbi:radical SAM/SPASM domain-containing protein [Frankia sp. AgB32]|uniref:radical SAM/SPASM domain-containing protein n=1 Tax=Frankia sp. AgB32 TaxID=631119 RepID=UPI00200E4C8D|nr:radical SAM protein [Frankia sp. AgB32]MCK9893371.1 radical SAM protein [Frankia sp. AgB32]
MSTATMPATATVPIRSLWLEVTGRCQLSCTHCYASSGPTGGHGEMTAANWHMVIDDAAALGVRSVQFIGGEPTLYPDLDVLVGHALSLGLSVEVYTNLLHITDDLWRVFGQPGVRLATSYYSATPDEHDRITGRTGSYVRTRANIIEALRRDIPLRVGLIGDGETADRAHSALLALGVTDIRRDEVRAFGRAAGGDATEGPCGACGLGRAAILPDGSITPCVMSRDLVGGNVRDTPLSVLVAEEAWRTAVEAVPRPLGVAKPCNPDNDTPQCLPANPEPDPNIA